jgi:hypothetical protein
LLMVPLLLARKARLRAISREETIRCGFLPPNQLARRILGGLMRLETSFPFPVPFGTSLLAWGRVQTAPDG